MQTIAYPFLVRVVRYFSRLKSEIDNFLLIRKAFLNHASLMMAIHKSRYPLRVIGKKEGSVTVSNFEELLLIAHSNIQGGLHYDNRNDILTIYPEKIRPDEVHENMKEGKITLCGCRNNGEVISIFLEDEYNFLPVKGKIVIDVGANIGDSCIYFCLRGAERVIGLEPFPVTYELAKRNITVNNLSSKVDLILAALGAKSGNLTIDPNFVSNPKSRAVNFEQGAMIPVLTLADIIKKFSLSSKDIILKIDCEGCEYKSVLNASEDLLRTFSYIQIEYHNESYNLIEKLVNSGFKVGMNSSRSSNFDHGFIYARRD